jgi:hypothetical protein
MTDANKTDTPCDADLEIEVLSAVYSALKRVDQQTRTRILEWVEARLEADERAEP